MCPRADSGRAGCAVWPCCAICSEASKSYGDARRYPHSPHLWRSCGQSIGPAGTPLRTLCHSMFRQELQVPANREGQRVPQVTFRTRTESEWKNLNTDDIFKGKTVVVFSLPGAFTPT